ncbi:hypothetical protein [Bacillus wiedmannii]|uniref:hypothetical protein n=1 Tax=Bacillus wiedmannii TaxID=1890302 RepID=UPI00115F2E60
MSEYYNNHKRKCKHDYPIVNVNVDCCDHRKEEKPSAFKAIKVVNQPVTAGASVKVLYQNEQFDLGYEYNPTTSTFIPLTDGVYNLMASVTFFPTVPGTPFKVFINFRINNVFLGGDSEFQGAIALSNIIATNTLQQLKGGDVVEVFASATVPGQFFASEDQSRFTGFKVA